MIADCVITLSDFNLTEYLMKNKAANALITLTYSWRLNVVFCFQTTFILSHVKDS